MPLLFPLRIDNFILDCCVNLCAVLLELNKHNGVGMWWNNCLFKAELLFFNSRGSKYFITIFTVADFTLFTRASYEQQSNLFDAVIVIDSDATKFVCFMFYLYWLIPYGYRPPSSRETYHSVWKVQRLPETLSKCSITKLSDKNTCNN